MFKEWNKCVFGNVAQRYVEVDDSLNKFDDK